MTVLLQLLPSPLNVQDCLQAVSTPAAGGIDVFIGTVRNQTGKKVVKGLEFEAYEPMALRELQKIAEQMQARWTLTGIAIQHRLGWIATGETAVIIAVSSEHRAAAFEACKFAIDTLKETVPIWKREVFEDGSVWVSAHP